MLEKYDVVIVGAGPTGLALAAQLLHDGVSASSVLLVDALKEPLIQTKASVLWPRSLELLYNISPEIIQEINERARTFSNLLVKTNDSEVLLKTFIGDKFDSEYTYGVLCEQWFTEKVLTNYLARKGLTVTRSAKLRAFNYEAAEGSKTHPLKIEVDTANGKKTISAKYLVGSDGARSNTRKLSHIGFEGEVLAGSFIAVHFTTKQPFTCQDSLILYLRSHGSSFITEMPNKSFLCAIDLDGDQQKPFFIEGTGPHGEQNLREPTFGEYATIIQDRIDKGIQLDKIIWSTHFRINERVASKYSDGNRVFLAGDACHAHSPLGGQGQNTGIQDAINLGWKLALVLQGKSSDIVLKSYEPERMVIGQRLIQLTTLGQKNSSSRNQTFQFLRNRIMKIATSQDFVLSTLGQILGETIYNYRDSVVSAEHWEKPPIFPSILLRRRQNILRIFGSRITAGDRVTSMMLTTVAPDFLAKNIGFVLILFEGLLQQNSDMDLTCLEKFGEQMIKKTLGLISAFVVVKKEQLCDHKYFGVDGQCLFLVRPDRYVAFRCEPVRADLLKGYLRDRVGVVKFDESALAFQVSKFKPVTSDWIHWCAAAAVIVAVVAIRNFHHSS